MNNLKDPIYFDESLPDLVVPRMETRIKEVYPYGRKPENILDIGCAAMAVEKYLRTLPYETLVSINSVSGYALNYFIAANGSSHFIDLNIAAYNVLQAAVASGADTVLLLHNHPTGEAKPSQGDLNSLFILRQLCHCTDIEVMDLQIIGLDEEMFSCRKHYPQYLEVIDAKKWEQILPPEIKGLNTNE